MDTNQKDADVSKIYTHAGYTVDEFARHRANVVRACWQFRFLARSFRQAGNASSANYCREQIRARLVRLRKRRSEPRVEVAA